MENHVLKFGEITLEDGFDFSVFAAVRGSAPLDQLPIAMAYVPFQAWSTTYEGAKALERGTIFPDLDLPFTGKVV